MTTASNVFPNGPSEPPSAAALYAMLVELDLFRALPGFAVDYKVKTLALLTAESPSEGETGYVYGDADPDNNGTYVYSIGPGWIFQGETEQQLREEGDALLAAGLADAIAGVLGGVDADGNTLAKLKTLLDESRTPVFLAGLIAAATAKTSLVSGDVFALLDSEASNGLKKITFENLLQAIVTDPSNQGAGTEALRAERTAKAARRRASGKKGTIYLTVGQSLSVRRNYSSGVAKVDWTSPHALMIAGGADRNADADVATNNTAFNADGVDYESLIAFVPSATQGGKVDGFAMMAEHPTVCGIYAIGAQDYSILRHGGSSLFKDTAMFLNQAVYLLRAQGCEDIDIVVSIAHGEAETDSVVAGGNAGSPTPPAVYELCLQEWRWDLTMFSRIALDDPTYEPIFIVHQMAGVFSDPWRAIMQATANFADTYANVHLAGPTAPYGLEGDKVHPPGEAQALMGEWDWHLYQRAKAGLQTCVRAHEFRRNGATIIVPHNFVEGSVEVGINAGNMTDASGFQSSGAKCVYGVEVLVDGAPVDITSVTPSGLVTTIVLAADPGAATVEVRFGMMTTPSSLGGAPATISRCNIRSDWTGIPSRYLPTFTHEAWLLHETVQEAA